MKTKVYDDLEKDISIDCNALRLPDKIRDEAIVILKKYLLKKTLKGRPLDTYSGALIWLAVRKWDYPITAKKINETLNLDDGKVKGELIITRLGKKLARITEDKFIITSLYKYVEMIQVKVHSYPECQTRAMMLIDHMEKNNIDVGHNNPALASAIAYIADRIEGYKVVEVEYTKAVGTTAVSLRNYKRKLMNAIPNIKQHGLRYKWKEDLIF